MFALYGGQSVVPSNFAKLLRSLLSTLAQEIRDGWHACRLADELKLEDVCEVRCALCLGRGGEGYFMKSYPCFSAE